MSNVAIPVAWKPGQPLPVKVRSRYVPRLSILDRRDELPPSIQPMSHAYCSPSRTWAKA